MYWESSQKEEEREKDREKAREGERKIEKLNVFHLNDSHLISRHN